MVIIPLISDSEEEMVFVVKQSSNQMNTSYIMEVTDIEMSFFDREGGFHFNNNTKEITFWGEPHSCTWAQCG